MQDAPIEDLDLTTALNFNRELFTSNEGMLMAAPDSGWTVRRPNCVSATPTPRNAADRKAKMMAAMGRLWPIARALANPRAGL